MKTEVPPRILALRDHYLMVLRDKTDTELLVFVSSKIGNASDRHLFVESVKGVTGIPLMRKCIEVCAANHRGDTVPRLVEMMNDTITIVPPPSDVFTHGSSYQPLIRRAIAIAPVLESEKRKKVSDPIVTVEEIIVIDEGIIVDENSIVDEEIVLTSLVYPDIVGMLEEQEFRSDVMGAALLKRASSLPPVFKVEKMSTMLPDPMPNMRGVSGIQKNVLPKEEKEFGKLTKREKGKKVSPVCYDAPAPNSDHGTFGRVEPGSGQYRQVEPTQDETVPSNRVELAVMKNKKGEKNEHSR